MSAPKLRKQILVLNSGGDEWIEETTLPSEEEDHRTSMAVRGENNGGQRILLLVS